MLLLLIAGLALTAAEQGLRLTVMRVIGLLLGMWIILQLLGKGSVCVWGWEVKGPGAAVLAGFGALLGAVSAYCLVRSLF